MTPMVYVAFTWRCCINGPLSKRGGSLASGPSAVPEKFIVLFVFKRVSSMWRAVPLLRAVTSVRDWKTRRCRQRDAPRGTSSTPRYPSRAVAAFFPEDIR